MKTVKAWEALKAFQEEGRKCRPFVGDQESAFPFCPPGDWKNFGDGILIWELEPPKAQVVEFEATQAISRYHWDMKRFYVEYSVEFSISKEVAKKLNGKSWKVTCTEITK